MARAMVVLPQPDSPTSPNDSCCPIWNETSLTVSRSVSRTR